MELPKQLGLMNAKDLLKMIEVSRGQHVARYAMPDTDVQWNEQNK